MAGATPSLMAHALSVIPQEPSAMGLNVAIAVSLTAHALLFWVFMQRPHTPPALPSAGLGPLHMSLKSASPLTPNQVPRTEPVIRPAPTKLEAPSRVPTPQATLPSPTPEVLEQAPPTTESNSPQTNAANAALLPPQMGGQGRWGSRSMPMNRGPQNMNQGPASVMPLLNRLAGQLPPSASCDIQINASWSTAFISCNEDNFKGYTVGFLSQQLRIQNTADESAHCFKLSNGSLNTVGCRN
jgi:hypothetical protein